MFSDEVPISVSSQQVVVRRVHSVMSFVDNTTGLLSNAFNSDSAACHIIFRSVRSAVFRLGDFVLFHVCAASVVALFDDIN